MKQVLAWIFGQRETEDGIGQTTAEDLLYLRRFSHCRREWMIWYTPDVKEAREISEHPVLGRFGDDTVAVASIQGRRWIVRERDWHGWPDPPRFVFFALEGDMIWSAADFNNWPLRWQRPERGHI